MCDCVGENGSVWVVHPSLMVHVHVCVSGVCL